MSEAKQKNEWSQTASILALIANCHRDPKQRRRPYKPNDFNPFAPKPKQQTRKLSWNEVRTYFGLPPEDEPGPTPQPKDEPQCLEPVKFEPVAPLSNY